MATISQALAIAAELHQAGRLAEAEQVCRQILAAEPTQPDAWHMLGVMAHQLGRHEVAVERIQRAIAAKGDTAPFHNSLGEAHRALRCTTEAVACYRRALELQPDYAEAHNNLGNAWKDQGKLDEAVACYRRALQLKPGFAEALNNLGVACGDQGHAEEALACFRQAIQWQPGLAETHYNLGNALRDRQQLEQAAACYRQAVQLKPGHVKAHCSLGLVLKAQGKLAEAAASLRQALQLDPAYADAHNNLGNVLRGQRKLDEAVASYRRALQLQPELAEAHSNLGSALLDQGQLSAAAAAFRRALELMPDGAEVHNNLGNALRSQGLLEESLACYRRALQLKAGYAAAHSNLLLALQYCPGVGPAELAAAHVEFDRARAASLRDAGGRHVNDRDPQRRLRLGFVSPDLGRHPVGQFLVGVLENLSPERHATICYSDRLIPDALTDRLRAAATQWHDVAGLSDQQLDRQIRSDRIDILFDLAGHTAGNRLPVFARKPAPLQITWIGYEGTTGLSAMDYLLADRHVIPEGAEGYYREQVLRMPEGYVCYDPPAAPPAGPLPARRPGEVTLGSFNNLSKITAQVVGVWAEILRRLPDARLVLKYRGLGDKSTQRRYRELFAGQGVEAGRLALLPASSYQQYLAAYGQIDLALDPFPFSGGATTCEALWMGVPVVTCPGETFASRHSLSHLSNLGLTETIAGDLNQYVEITVALAHDLPRLAAIRAGLREQMAASPLCDAPRFAAHLMVRLRDVWQRWCAGKG